MSDLQHAGGGCGDAGFGDAIGGTEAGEGDTEGAAHGAEEELWFIVLMLRIFDGNLRDRRHSLASAGIVDVHPADSGNVGNID